MSEFSSASLQHLNELLEHPSAPSFNFESSDLLNAKSLSDVQSFAQDTTTFWEPGKLPGWMPQFLARVFREVPYFRELGDVPSDFEAIPTTSRRELESPELLIPDSVTLDDLTVYFTSGTSGTRVRIPTDPAVSSKVLVLMERLLASHDLRLRRGAGKVAIAALFHQDNTLTYPSLSRYLDGAATVKLNLHPSSWSNQEDPVEYLRSLEAGVITGCPYSLSVLAELAPDLRPVAIFSSAVHLGAGLRDKLHQSFECPIIDVYSLTEAKFIAADAGQGSHDLISPDLYVEILDEKGRVVKDGERGEITITGGRNLCLPMVRYRTGDFASLQYRGRQPYLCELQGRAPVELFNAQGQSMSELDIVNTLREFPIVGFSYVQQGADSFEFRYCGDVTEDSVTASLKQLTGWDGKVTQVEEWPGKPQAFARQP